MFDHFCSFIKPSSAALVPAAAVRGADADGSAWLLGTKGAAAEADDPPLKGQKAHRYLILCIFIYIYLSIHLSIYIYICA